jgi:hypothetical protein
MRRLLLFALLLFAAVPLAVRAQDCTGKPRFSLSAANPKTVSIAFPKTVTVPTTLTVGSEVTLSIGDKTYPATVAKVFSFVPDVTTVQLDLAEPIENDPSSGFTSGSVSLTTSGNVVDVCSVTPLNYEMMVGPTVTPLNSDTSSNGDPNGAIRFQFQKGFVRTVEVNHDPTLIPSMRNAQEELSLSIDTTDRQAASDKKFVDDNHITGALRSPAYTFGPKLTHGLPFFNRVRAGLEGQFARAVHGENRNRDITVVVNGWLPFFQAINLLSAGREVTLPLAFRISGGHRHQDVDGTESGGRVADASLTYHFYVLDHYVVDLTAKTLLNDVSDRPPSTPRTQHSYKAQVAYKKDVTSQFAVVATFEDGHSGPVFTKLRQFFLGVGVQQVLQIPTSP